MKIIFSFSLAILMLSISHAQIRFPRPVPENIFPGTGNAGIGTRHPAYTLTVNGITAGVSNASWTPGNNLFQGISSLNVNGAGGALSNQYTYFGEQGSLNLNLSSNFSDYRSDRPSNFSGVGSSVYKVNTGSLTLGVVSGYSAFLNVENSGGISEYASFRSCSPQQLYNRPAFSGTITNYYGLLLESSQAFTGNIDNQITNKYGVYQSGNLDNNYFAGKVGIGTNAPSQILTVFNGTTTGTYTTAGWVSSSDKRLKTNIESITSAMDIINKLNGVYYEWSNNRSAGRQIGFVAQDVKKVLPEVVVGKEGDIKKGETLSMAYQNIVPILVEALKEKDKEITDLKKRFEEIEKVLYFKADPSSPLDGSFEVKQNSPNPFHSLTTIPYSIEKAGYVISELYALNGAKVKTLENGYKEKGSYTLTIDGSTLASGTYIYIINIDKKQVAKKAIKF